MSVGSPLTVTQAFDRVARWFPANEAVVDSAFRLTYAQLDDASRRCAALFRKLGAEPKKPLALLTAPSAIHLVAWLGAVRMGAIPAVLHTRESAETLSRVCQKIEPILLVYDASMEVLAEEVVTKCPALRASVRAQSALPAKLTGTARPAVELLRDLPTFPADGPLAHPAEDDPAMIVLSSGTTSVPKGIVHTHRGLLENARTNCYMYSGLRPTDRSLVPLSTAFIGCYNGWFPFLNAGGCTIFMEHFDLDAAVAKIASERATHVFLTPTLWRRLLATDLSKADFSSVRQAGFAAEVMDAGTLKKLQERVSPNVVQVYGSTETGAGATCMWADEMVGERLTSVGRPLLNGDLKVVVPGGGLDKEVPRGERGEILISSPSLAVEAWRDPEMTQKLFVEDGERRWWRSRDLGRLDADGYLYIEGRHDDMIISGGLNIMPARVEEVLLKHPDVAECAVVGVPHPEWGEQVQAFVVARKPGLTSETLEEFMRQSELSAYQRPRVYTFVSELPRTSTNKVSRRVLRDRATSAQKSANP